MTIDKRQILRRLIPAVSVASVIGFSFIAQGPTLASSTGNCGVKAGYGYATHDHGKPCPNRPFPGRGEGVERILAGIGETPSSTSPTNGKSKNSIQGTSTTSDMDELLAQTKASVHGKAGIHGRGHAEGKGHQ
jgi:hypothetical protein